MLESIFFRLLDSIQDFRRVRFRTHLAFFQNNQVPHVFLTVTNLSRSREIEITHVWLETYPIVSALVMERSLPVRLLPDQIWETWIPVKQTPVKEISSVLKLGRVRLSDGRVIKSRPDRNVPPEGFVPGSDLSKGSK